ncbi:argininosuccinate synthase [Deferribacter desulfuricans SSM1]|uniref:Argininosuccinate synthase n=1 Tax=Deferribacter desulfuricans (strain DSM 14783 / JCM 11476 / NBRC 101012 / SSM1) TaxID=639282 RepID=D3P8P5_DEFDS|nr:argininosuccinate synthase [Deferribacter desulfuricans]BAI81085.1 argininosuccinate synthase [Deferribacter desulfuricans SSM1]
MSREKVVLAYSGGLDTSVILKWLDLQGYDVVAYVADLGQRDDLEALEEKAYKSGAKEFYIVDLKDEFVKNYVYTSIKFNAVYEGRYLLGTSLARPVIAKGMVDIARKTGAKYVAHGATGKGNDQVRFELSVAALAPDLKVIAPWRIPEFFNVIKGRQEAIDFAAKYGIPVKATKDKPWSSDENLMHISFEAGILEDPAKRPPEDMFELTVDPKNASDTPEEVEIEFEKGEPVAVNGEKLSPAKLLQTLNEIGGRHGIGRIDIVESRYVGMKSRGVYETPGGTILMAAHRDLEGLTLEGSLINLKDMLMPRFAYLVYAGYWFSSEMDCLRAFVEESQKYVTGKVKVELYKGNITIVSRESKYSLYDQMLVSMDDDKGAYNQADATGFIKLNSLPLIANARRRDK